MTREETELMAMTAKAMADKLIGTQLEDAAARAFAAFLADLGTLTHRARQTQ